MYNLIFCFCYYHKHTYTLNHIPFVIYYYLNKTKYIYRNPSSPNKQQHIDHIISTKSHTNYPSDCKPNINDLRQLFDSSRYEFKRNFNAQTQSYYDPKPQQQQQHHQHQQNHHHHGAGGGGGGGVDENMFMEKSALSRNYDFEKAKQKFDKPTSLKLSKLTHQTPKQFLGNFLKLGNNNSSSSSSSKIINNSCSSSSNNCGVGGDSNKGKILNENCLMQYDDNNCRSGGGGSGSKKDSFMNNSLNLDELKVSEDDDVSNVYINCL